MISPTTGANLNPCPEQADVMTTLGCSGCLSTMKCPSGVLVYMQTDAASNLPFNAGISVAAIRRIDATSPSCTARSIARGDSTGGPPVECNPTFRPAAPCGSAANPYSSGRPSPGSQL